MKTLKQLFLIPTILFFTVLFCLTSCSKDEVDSLLGSWNTSDGGTVTFRAGGTGTTAGSNFFNFDCGTLIVNGVNVSGGQVHEFTWTEQQERLRLEFVAENSEFGCNGSMEFPIEYKGGDKIKVGDVDPIFGFGIEVELTR